MRLYLFPVNVNNPYCEIFTSIAACGSLTDGSCRLDPLERSEIVETGVQTGIGRLVRLLSQLPDGPKPGSMVLKSLRSDGCSRRYKLLQTVTEVKRRLIHRLIPLESQFTYEDQ